MSPDRVPTRLRTVQVLVASLVVGLVALSTVMGTTVVLGGGGRSRGLAEPLTMLLVLVFLASIIVSVLVGRSQIKRAREWWESASPPGEVADFAMPRYQVLVLLRGALLEGFGLLGAVASMVTGELFFLVAAGLALLGLLVTFPTTERFTAFVEELTGRRGV